MGNRLSLGRKWGIAMVGTLAGAAVGGLLAMYVTRSVEADSPGRGHGIDFAALFQSWLLSVGSPWWLAPAGALLGLGCGLIWIRNVSSVRSPEQDAASHR